MAAELGHPQIALPDEPLGLGHQAYADDAITVSRILATPALQSALLACAWLDLHVERDRIIFMDPRMKNLAAGSGGGLTLLLLGDDADKRFELLAMAHEQVASLWRSASCAAPKRSSSVRCARAPSRSARNSAPYTPSTAQRPDITNVGLVGEIPLAEPPSWSTPTMNPYNSYRRNAQGAKAFCAPDLQVYDLDVDYLKCPDLAMSVWVANLGCLGVGPFARSPGGGAPKALMSGRQVSCRSSAPKPAGPSSPRPEAVEHAGPRRGPLAAEAKLDPEARWRVACLDASLAGLLVGERKWFIGVRTVGHHVDRRKRVDGRGVDPGRGHGQ